MKIIVAGSRSITDYSLIEIVLATSKFFITEIVSGHAKGVDQLGERYANEYAVPLKIFPAKWDEYGKAAGYMRNSEMADYADGLIAIYDGTSKGTMHMIKTMTKKGKPVEVVNE